jgi:hypothetical protein
VREENLQWIDGVREAGIHFGFWYDESRKRDHELLGNVLEETSCLSAGSCSNSRSRLVPRT